MNANGRFEAGSGRGRGSESRKPRERAQPKQSSTRTTRTSTPAPPKNNRFHESEKDLLAAEKYTKGDLIDYYRAFRWLLPYLANRPVVLTRFPTGSMASRSIRRMAGLRARLDAHGPIWSEETHARSATSSATARNAVVSREHGIDPAAHLGEPRRVAGLADGASSISIPRKRRSPT